MFCKFIAYCVFIIKRERVNVKKNIAIVINFYMQKQNLTGIIMYISEILKKLRIKNNLTQKQLGDRLGIGQTTVACYENGTREPHIERRR